jgi:hypothetical protein
MGDFTSTQLNTELMRRVPQIISADAGAAINRAIKWVNRQGSYMFQLQAPTTLNVTSSGNIAAPADLDSGKAMYLANPSGLPIKQGALTDIGQTQNYNTITDSGFDQYVLKDSGTSTATFYFWPLQSGSTVVTLIYHLRTVDITGSTKSNLPRDFDDLLIDFAEAEERRIYDIGEIWPQILARTQDQIKVLLDAYRTESIETGLTSEAGIVTQEKTQVGRA